MKTITMDFSEYEKLVNANKELEATILKYKNSLITIYGEEAANNLFKDASTIEQNKNMSRLREAVYKGNL